MNIYIASSWKNQHAVEMLTTILREKGHTVESFIENRTEKERNYPSGEFDFDEWVLSEEGKTKFEYDTNSAMGADLVVYISPSGTDAWAEVGAAWGKGVPIVGLHAKGEPAGLMRRMVVWFNNYKDLIDNINKKDIEDMDVPF